MKRRGGTDVKKAALVLGLLTAVSLIKAHFDLIGSNEQMMFANDMQCCLASFMEIAPFVQRVMLHHLVF